MLVRKGFWVFCLSIGPLYSFAALSLRKSEASIVMENEKIRLEIDRENGRIVRILCEGMDLLDNGGVGYMQSYDENGFMSPKQTRMIVARNDEEVLDIGFVHQEAFAIDYECHYALRPDEPGFYNYIVYGSKADDSGKHRIDQLNYVLRLDPLLFTHFADGANVGELPTPQALEAGKKVMDATIELADGTVYTKYNHAANMDDHHRVHGLMGSGVGAWVIMPSHEFLNSVPFNSELTLHQTNTTPLLLRHVQAAHCGSGVLRFSTEEGFWQKWGGPWFFYFNRGDSMKALEKEAGALAERMTEEWPFQWIEDERFARERGCLSGRLIDGNGQPMAGALVVISQAADAQKPFDFQQQWRGYRFYDWTDEKGRFEIEKIWPDRYDLCAMKDDVPGRFSRYDLSVAANEITNVGTFKWDTPVKGRLLWKIGTLDRSGAEFGHGDNYRHWGLWMKIQEQFPEGAIAFDADVDQARKLPFILAAYVDEDLTYYDPFLQLSFTVPEAPKESNAKLLLAVAEARPDGGRNSFTDLSLSLNGAPLAEVSETFTPGGAIHRSGIRGHCQEATITFPTSRLQVGENLLEIALKPSRKPGTKWTGAPHIAIMFDCLWLELL